MSIEKAEKTEQAFFEKDLAEMLSDRKDLAKNPAARARLEAGRTAAEFAFRGYKQGKEIGKIFEEERDAGEVRLQDLNVKKAHLEKVGADLEKRFGDYKKLEKNGDSEKLLSSFGGEKRGLILESLDLSLNPVGYGRTRGNGDVRIETRDEGRKESDSGGDIDIDAADGYAEPKPKRENTADQKKHEEKRDKVRAEFEEKISQFAEKNGADPQALRMGTYLYLKEEKVFEAESQLNGTEKQKVDVRMRLNYRAADFAEVLDSNPGFADAMVKIAADARMNDAQKISAIGNVFEKYHLSLPKESWSIVEDYIEALARYDRELPLMEEKALDLEKTLRIKRAALEKTREESNADRELEKLED